MASLIKDVTCEDYYDLPSALVWAMSPGNRAVRFDDRLEGFEYISVLSPEGLEDASDRIELASYLDLRYVRIYSEKIPSGFSALISVCELYPISQENFSSARDRLWKIDPSVVDGWVFRGILTLTEFVH